jgi:hypothetical protein
MNTVASEIGSATFSKAWWDEFMRATSTLTQAAVVRNCLDRPKIALYEECVLEILRELARLRTNKYGYRVYVEGQIIEDGEMGAIYDAPPAIGEGFDSWIKRVFGDKRFGIIINKGEKFNHALSRDIALAMQPLFAQTGFPQEGVNFTLFIGNYDKTPLGIHQDKRGESVMHFHLGPGDKTMYLWEPEDYEAKISSGQYHRKNIAPLLPFARVFKFGPGDLFFMPEGTYHIGEQDSMSVAVTVWRYNHTDDRLFNNMHNLVHSNIRGQKSFAMRGDRNDADDTSALDPILSGYALADNLKGLSYADLIRETYRDWRLSLHSNAGFRGIPFARQEDGTFAASERVALEQPYQMRVKRGVIGGKMHVFVRGHKLEMRDFACIETLVNTLNDGRERSVGELLGLLDGDWPAAIGQHILGQLYRHHGIRKVDADVAAVAVKQVSENDMVASL